MDFKNNYNIKFFLTNYIMLNITGSVSDKYLILSPDSIGYFIGCYLSIIKKKEVILITGEDTDIWNDQYFMLESDFKKSWLMNLELDANDIILRKWTDVRIKKIDEEEIYIEQSYLLLNNTFLKTYFIESITKNNGIILHGHCNEIKKELTHTELIVQLNDGDLVSVKGAEFVDTNMETSSDHWQISYTEILKGEHRFDNDQCYVFDWTNPYPNNDYDGMPSTGSIYPLDANTLIMKETILIDDNCDEDILKKRLSERKKRLKLSKNEIELSICKSDKMYPETDLLYFRTITQQICNVPRLIESKRSGSDTFMYDQTVFNKVLKMVLTRMVSYEHFNVLFNIFFTLKTDDWYKLINGSYNIFELIYFTIYIFWLMPFEMKKLFIKNY